MKKHGRTIAPVIAFIMAVSLLAFCACAPSGAGSYKVYSVNTMSAEQYFTLEAQKNGLSLEEFFASFASEGFSGDPDDYITIFLGSDMFAEIKILGHAHIGMWHRSGDVITVSLENDTMELECISSIAKLRYVQDEQTEIIFGRAD